MNFVAFTYKKVTKFGEYLFRSTKYLDGSRPGCGCFKKSDPDPVQQVCSAILVKRIKKESKSSAEVLKGKSTVYVFFLSVSDIWQKKSVELSEYCTVQYSTVQFQGRPVEKSKIRMICPFI